MLTGESFVGRTTLERSLGRHNNVLFPHGRRRQLVGTSSVRWRWHRGDSACCSHRYEEIATSLSRRRSSQGSLHTKFNAVRHCRSPPLITPNIMVRSNVLMICYIFCALLTITSLHTASVLSQMCRCFGAGFYVQSGLVMNTNDSVVLSRTFLPVYARGEI